MVTFAYVGVQNAGPLAAVVLPSNALQSQAVLLPVSLAILLVLWPRIARAR